jgi:hypothetical protein
LTGTHLERTGAGIADLDKDRKNAAEEWDRSGSEWRTISANPKKATEAIERESSARPGAEAVRQVVEKIVVTFEATGKKSPIGRVKSVGVIPKTSREGDSSPCELEYPGK